MKYTIMLISVLAFVAACTPAEKKPAENKEKAPAAGQEQTGAPSPEGQAGADNAQAAGQEAAPESGAAAAAPGIPDSEIGLSKVSVFDTPEPPKYVPEYAEPGDKEVQPRAHASAPPVIPHEIREFLPITPKNNPCMDCHEGDAKPIPASHKTDLRNSPDAPGDSLTGARYNCVACHVPLTDAKPLVANQF